MYVFIIKKEEFVKYNPSTKWFKLLNRKIINFITLKPEAKIDLSKWKNDENFKKILLPFFLNINVVGDVTEKGVIFIEEYITKIIHNKKVKQ